MVPGFPYNQFVAYANWGKLEHIGISKYETVLSFNH